MLRANRIPGPIGRQTVGSSHQPKRAENDWISINPLDVAQGWTFRQSSQSNLVNLSTSASGIRVQQDITKNANSGSRWSASAMRADRYYAKLREERTSDSYQEILKKSSIRICSLYTMRYAI